ncbi:hypothetical protein H2248_010240 [Termitomyces sp. 'cryptogamus']|nr:hypothetical protein H2248_010240 [Termitomyces sp. 'cryptogamus']
MGYISASKRELYLVDTLTRASFSSSTFLHILDHILRWRCFTFSLFITFCLVCAVFAEILHLNLWQSYNINLRTVHA